MTAVKVLNFIFQHISSNSVTPPGLLGTCVKTNRTQYRVIHGAMALAHRGVATCQDLQHVDNFSRRHVFVTNLKYQWDANKRKTHENDLIVPPLNSQEFKYDDEDRLTKFYKQNDLKQEWNLSKVGDWSVFNSYGTTCSASDWDHRQR